MSSRVPPAIPGEAGGSARAEGDAMSTAYVTLWLLTSAYAAPLGYYATEDTCRSAAGQLAVPPAAQILCVPSEVGQPPGAASVAAQAPATESPASAAPTVAADSAKVSAAGVPFIGDEKAPVVMAYWYDYQCPFCKQNEETVLPRLIKDYVETGKVKVLFKDFAFLGPDSQTAGYAARAVWEVAPDKFYLWHKAVFDHQGQENTGWATKDKIIALTKSIPGIDTDKVAQLMADHATDYQKAIDADGAEGAAMGVNGSPGAIIGTQLIVGAQPYEQLKAAIDAALGQK
jgi:protein-disulfide isomerase